MVPSTAMIADGAGRRSARTGADWSSLTSARSSLSAATAARKANSPKSSSPQEPTDIGTQDLNIGRPVLDWISMCQKRSGRVRSAESRKPLIATPTKAR